MTWARSGPGSGKSPAAQQPLRKNHDDRSSFGKKGKNLGTFNCFLRQIYVGIDIFGRSLAIVSKVNGGARGSFYDSLF